MIQLNKIKLSISILLSIIFHLLFLFFFLKITNNKKIEKIYVVNLAKFKEFKSVESKKIDYDKKKEKISVEKKQENNTNKIIKKESKLPDQNLGKTKLPKTFKNKSKDFETDKIKQNKLERIKKNYVKKKMDNSKQLNIKEKIITSQTKKEAELLVNEILSQYLISLSREINLLANNSYPKRAISRREQGRIVSRLTIDSKGIILNVKLLTKRPKSLVESANKILKKKKKFLKPPQTLFKNKKVIVVEVPINYVLQ